MENEKALMVYMVVGGIDYEGECWDLSGKIFMSREAADRYAKSLSDGSQDMVADYVLVREVEVEG